ncbi:MAG: hypothetical protein MMC33_009586 [Icmadophila ericetorum]|nr:hypothetical protein [Icmadophila ericetorum]
MADSLRVFHAELLLARSIYETSERLILKSILYPEASRSWQIGATPHSYAFTIDSTRSKKRKLQIEEIEAQTVDIGDGNLGEDGSQAFDMVAIIANASTLFKLSPSCPWKKYLDRFADYRIQGSSTPMGPMRAFRLLQMVASFGCPEHFVALKGAITHYRLLGPEEVLNTPLDLSNHLYKVGIWTECLGLINAILQRLVRAHFTSLINEGKDLFLDGSGQVNLQSGSAITKAIKAMVVSVGR